MRRLWLLAALLAVCAGCGGPVTGPRDEGLVKPDDAAAAADTPPTPRTVHVFFLQYGKPTAVTRRIAGGSERETLLQALAALLKGPTKVERKAGYFSPIDSTTQLLDVETDDFNDATTNFTEPFNIGTSNKPDEVPLKVAIIAKTLGGLGIRGTTVQVTGSTIPIADRPGNQRTEVDATQVDHYLAADQYATFTCNASTAAAKGSPRLTLATPKTASRVTDRTVQFSGRVTGASTVLTIELFLVKKGAHIGLGTLSRTCDGSFSGSMLAPLGVTGPIAFRAAAADSDGKHPTARRRALDLDPTAVR